MSFSQLPVYLKSGKALLQGVSGGALLQGPGEMGKRYVLNALSHLSLVRWRAAFLPSWRMMRNEACHLSVFQHPVNLPVSLGDACLFFGGGQGSEPTGVKTQFVGDPLIENDKAT